MKQGMKAHISIHLSNKCQLSVIYGLEETPETFYNLNYSEGDLKIQCFMLSYDKY